MRRAVLQAEAGTRAGHVTGVQTCALPILQAQSWAISSDIVPDSHAARFGGIMNFGGYFGGALAPIVTGAVVDATGSYTPSFLVAGLIAVLGGLCYGFMVRKPIHSIA